jgi:hypothetical protein
LVEKAFVSENISQKWTSQILNLSFPNLPFTLIQFRFNFLHWFFSRIIACANQRNHRFKLRPMKLLYF